MLEGCGGMQIAIAIIGCLGAEGAALIGNGDKIYPLGFLVFTLMLKVAVPTSRGEFIGRPQQQAEIDAPVAV
jgi:hypothetical protein